MSDRETLANQGGRRSLNLAELQNVFVSIRKDLVRYIARRVGNQETAADLSHDMFEKLASVQAEIPTAQKASSYLYRMAGNLAIDYTRVEARRAEILTGSQVLFEDVMPCPDAVAVSRDELRQVEAALDELPEKCRQVLVLSRVHGYSHREIAQHLDVSVSLVEKYQLRALRHCRDRLAQGM
ncbi:RNA polymerase sigma factor [Sphingobium sp. H39-3-25]|uniref:RNA polymerase sigma factor n=1 Tax=Sphingobium arseniciresistens TaxID=3030834 RepID=UPI0023B9EEA4|nr:RNA polymerase sigma factor [Sphingobium arseniciresistens]